MLDELSSNGLIEVYDVENKRYLQITGWHHQKIDRPQKAKCPAPIKSETNVRRMLVGGKDRKGEDRKVGNAPELSSSLRSEEVLPHSSTSELLTIGNQEKSKRKKRSSADKELADRVTDEWNAIARDFPRLSAVKAITDQRESAVLARAKELVDCFDAPDAIAGFLSWANKIRGSPFLRGEKGWKPSFDWAVKPANFTKIMEGVYDHTEENRSERYNSYRFGGNNRT